MMTRHTGSERTPWSRRSPLWMKFFAVLSVLSCSGLGVTCAATNNIKVCFDGSESDPPGNVTLSCPDGYVISIDEALFGRNQWVACVITDGDCVEKTRIFENCEGLNNCTRTFKTYSPKCGYSSILLLSYTCLQAYVTPKTTTSFTEAEGYENWEGQPAEGTAAPPPTQKPKDDGDDMKDIGLIVGCVVAAIATTIALIIAIIMVIRRLMQYRRKERSDGGTDSPESGAGSGYTCMDQFSCCNTGQTNVHDEHDMVVRKKTAPALGSSGPSTGKALGKTKTRIPPVGQESSTDDLTGKSEAPASSVPAHRNESSPNGAENHDWENKTCNNSGNAVLESSFNTKAVSSPIKQTHSSSLNDSQEVPAEFRDDHFMDAGNNNNSGKLTKDNSVENETVTQSAQSDDKREDPSQNKKTEFEDTSSGRCGTQSEPKHGHTIGPRYDAVAIPNTEQGTAC